MAAAGWVGIGASICALSVLAGAFGAHGLKARLDPAALELWETAARYFMYTGFGLVAVGFAGQLFERPVGAAGWSLLAGGVIFAGTVAVLALGGPRWLGAVTPIGGVLMVVGLVLLALAAFRA
jgi:uncharacterized membrane protein YgdD (TMEM256/DUF423 family)